MASQEIQITLPDGISSGIVERQATCENIASDPKAQDVLERINDLSKKKSSVQAELADELEDFHKLNPIEDVVNTMAFSLRRSNHEKAGTAFGAISSSTNSRMVHATVNRSINKDGDLGQVPELGVTDGIEKSQATERNDQTFGAEGVASCHERNEASIADAANFDELQNE